MSASDEPSRQRPARTVRRKQKRSDVFPTDIDLTLAQVQTHAQSHFPDAFAALPTGDIPLLKQTIDPSGSSLRLKIGHIRIKNMDYTLCAYMRQPFTVRFSYDGGKCPLPDDIRLFRLDFPFRCPLLAATGHLTNVYPELESLIGYFMVKQGVIPTFRDAGSRNRPSLSALRTACMSILAAQEHDPRAPTIAHQNASADDAPGKSSPTVSRITVGDDTATQDSESSDEGLFVPDSREMTKEQLLEYDLKEARKVIRQMDKFIRHEEATLDQRDADIEAKNNTLREYRQKLINERRNGNHMKLEANNLEHYVGNLRREMEDLLNDNVTLFHRAQRAERELARMKAAQRRHNEP